MRKTAIVIATVCGLVLVGAGLVLRPWWKEPPLKSGAIKSLDIEWRAVRDGDRPGRTTTSDVPKIEALATLLREGEPAEDHKCADSAELTFHRVDGTLAHVGFLAGHDATHDEFRSYQGDRYGVYRVDRSRFRKAMADLGVTGLDPGTVR